MIIFITKTPWPPTPEIIEAAKDANQIVHGFPDWVVALGIETEGRHEIPEPKPDIAGFNAAQKEARNAAYRDEADPLYFKWQAGESTESDWRDKRAEIKTRFPYIDEAVKV